MTSKSYVELCAELEALQGQVEEARQAELHQVVVDIRKRAEAYGLTAADIFGSLPRAGQRIRRAPAAVRYRDPDTGRTWSGRGRQPQWIAQAADREQYRVA
ncbi:H-NS histone family protein (plasmid) [Burkholderia gladioli]|uniref:H-NS histone family protein n=1 Tax=Burkholderia gladioli TaxID=28095 RepID=UPI001364A35F|nr:H-NS histone family protein [Burkholderia gladioli]KAF1060778.1 DNA-binding protein Bv3F [Burkholderia gladioli]MBU9426405.1 H-NS histone family protein [Burkholderia gladioli]MDN8063483.1 H-NS histone family protein [Burkholderia gladioli]WAG21722.1 H-NS histone family protein [Burkholderia gladioli]